MQPRSVGLFLVPMVGLVFLGEPAGPTETARIQRHLRGAEVILAGRDLAALSAAQLANRAAVTALLREYRQAGRFPSNEDFADRRVPYFRDRHGNLCAMAFLLEKTGYRPIVDRISRTRNNAYIAQLIDEPGLAEWLDRFGITPAEAARIQPTYSSPQSKQISTGYAIASAVGLGLSTTGAAMSLTGSRSDRRAASLAAGAGFVTAMLGAGKLNNDGDVRTLGVVNVVVGGIAALIGVNGLVGRRDELPTGRQPEGRRYDVGFTVGPRGEPGFVATIRF